ncbi:Hypothetical_protein [Hexamita inflata]|uniref:Hypothetical_protein n=1 Tax=Hexamita inflata TaxID=28002 RepID=A0AA86N9A5_9EUKA|nr:Hypothetical protein HINF_LOCUS2840 [Hexamita inflata]CAI9977097.1 Hypothetical protein HINF_LOCUS64742 [Hexamita inflata]
MTLIMSTQGKDTDQLLTFSKQDQQLLCEYEIDEIEANIKLTFTAPQYTINNNRYSILNEQNDWIDVLLPFKRKIDDETQLLSIIQNLSDNNYRYEVDNDYFINNNKLKFKATNFKAFKSDDHYFCKAFGLVKGTIYERDEQDFITATNILYPYIYKYICINCYDIQDYTLIDQGQKRYLLLKQFIFIHQFHEPFFGLQINIYSFAQDNNIQQHSLPGHLDLFCCYKYQHQLTQQFILLEYFRSTIIQYYITQYSQLIQKPSYNEDNFLTSLDFQKDQNYGHFLALVRKSIIGIYHKSTKLFLRLYQIQPYQS